MNGYPDGCIQADHDAAYGRDEGAILDSTDWGGREFDYSDDDDLEHPGDDVCSDPLEE